MKDILKGYNIDNNLLQFQNYQNQEDYFLKITKYIQYLEKYLSTNQTNKEVEFLYNFTIILKNSFQALNIKYKKTEIPSVFLKENLFTIDPSSSGFPHFTEILDLENDYKLSSDFLTSLNRSEEILKNDIFLNLLKNEEYPIKSLNLLLKKQYNEELQNKKTIKTFDIVAFEIIENETAEDGFIKNLFEKENKYLISWYIYDTSINIPIFYYMEFITSQSKIDKIKDEFFTILRQNSFSIYKLDGILKTIDDKYNYLHPKKISRYFIGPFFSNNITNHSKELVDILNKGNSEDRKSILSFSMENLVSSGQQEKDNFLFGSTKREIYFINNSSKECLERGVSNYESFSLIPFEIQQTSYENENYIKILNQTKKITILQNEDIV